MVGRVLERFVSFSTSMLKAVEGPPY